MKKKGKKIKVVCSTKMKYLEDTARGKQGKRNKNKPGPRKLVIGKWEDPIR